MTRADHSIIRNQRRVLNGTLSTASSLLTKKFSDKKEFYVCPAAATDFDPHFSNAIFQVSSINLMHSTLKISKCIWISSIKQLHYAMNFYNLHQLLGKNYVGYCELIREYNHHSSKSQTLDSFDIPLGNFFTENQAGCDEA